MTALLADVREMLREQVEYRELLYRMTARDLLLRYKQAVMGLGWALFMPVLNLAIFSVMFTRVVTIDVGMPYPLYAYCGLVAWNFFASALKFSASALTSNAALVTKIYFPREIFPFSAVLVSLVDAAIAGLLLVALMAYYGVAPAASLAFLPVVVLVQVAFTTGIALLLAMANLFYRDVKYLFEIVLAVWMFATSVVYPVERIGGRLAAVLAWNPLTPIIDAYRAVILRGELPAAGPFAAAAALSFAVLALGWLAFHRAEFKFAENI